MSETASPVPQYRTGWLWIVLAVLLMIGTVGAAFVAYGVSDLLQNSNWLLDVPLAVGGGVVASISMLLLTGMLYRVDRLRGVYHREVRLFE